MKNIGEITLIGEPVFIVPYCLLTEFLILIVLTPICFSKLLQTFAAHKYVLLVHGNLFVGVQWKTFKILLVSVKLGF